MISFDSADNMTTIFLDFASIPSAKLYLFKLTPESASLRGWERRNCDLGSVPGRRFDDGRVQINKPNIVRNDRKLVVL